MPVTVYTLALSAEHRTSTPTLVHCRLGILKSVWPVTSVSFADWSSVTAV